jgi:lysine 2,3-aminomutase
MDIVKPLWTHEFQKSFKNLKDLYSYLEWEMPLELLKVVESYSVFIPQKLAAKIKKQGPNGVLAREFLPHLSELDPRLNSMGFDDPIGDKEFNKAPQLIHRYPNRVLFTATSVCPVQCRYCFRKNELNASDEIFQKSFEKTIHYLIEHSEISEIIFTGGDPLTLSNEMLEKYLNAFAKVPSIKDIRFHSRYPVIMPSRLDGDFFELIHKFARHFRTLSLAIHANHVDEFDCESNSKIKELRSLNLQLLSQTVLLKGVNDSVPTLKELYEHFIDLKVRPYYLHHPDRVKGGMHFTLPLSLGRKIYAELRKILPGWAQPQYVLDVPGGSGKISAFNPETFEYSGKILTLNSTQIQLSEPPLFD